MWSDVDGGLVMVVDLFFLPYILQNIDNDNEEKHREREWGREEEKIVTGRAR